MPNKARSSEFVKTAFTNVAQETDQPSHVLSQYPYKEDKRVLLSHRTMHVSGATECA